MNLSTVSSLFKKTMQREKKIICDYYDTQKKYEVFFRRDNRSTSPQGKMRLYYENSQGIQIGTIYNYKNKNYLVVSQDAQESEVYYTSLDVDGTMTLLKEGIVEVTTTWQEEKISCKTEINVVDNSVKPGEIIGTSSIQGGKNISYGKSKKYIAHFYDKTGKEVTGVEADWSISKPTSLENEVTMQYQEDKYIT